MLIVILSKVLRRQMRYCKINEWIVSRKSIELDVFFQNNMTWSDVDASQSATDPLTAEQVSKKPEMS